MTSKWVENVSKLIGAHSQKNCGSATGAPVGPAFADRSDAPRTISANPSVSPGLEIGELAVDLDPALPAAELGEAGVVEHHTHADLLVEVRLLDRGRAAHEGEVGAQPVLGGFDHDAQCVQRFEHLDA